ncbi:GATA type zinc finger transcription factor family protein [Medicago truncatula]|uniref:GATA type zinc finger transcription factor family protein n=1 Tax=Medicago truncatula TaxID=3880 RepID=G7IT19_MEDTR|nr:GATA type zinc finger transcription factor family protein [Medicago truncatula]
MHSKKGFLWFLSLAPGFLFLGRYNNALVLVRKCTHCEATKTPQWRIGSEGPKVLLV